MHAYVLMNKALFSIFDADPRALMLGHMQQGLLYGSKHKRLEISMGEF